MKTIIDQLNENLTVYPHMINEFEVIDSPEGVIVTLNSITPPRPNGIITFVYQSIISDCAPVSAEMIASYSQGVLCGRAQYFYVFAVQENKNPDFSKDDDFASEPYHLETSPIGRKANTMIEKALETLLTQKEGNCATFLNGKVHVITDGKTLSITDNRNGIGHSLFKSLEGTVDYLQGAGAQGAVFSKI